MHQPKDIEIFVNRIRFNHFYIYIDDFSKNLHLGHTIPIAKDLQPFLQKYTNGNFNSEDSEQCENYGKALYELLFNQKLQDYLNKILEKNEADQVHTRLSFRYAAREADLNQIQWELLHNNNQFLNTRELLSITRLPEHIGGANSGALTVRLNLCLIVSNPDNSSVEIDDKSQFSADSLIQLSLPLIARREINIHVLTNPTLQEIVEYTSEQKIHILWFDSIDRAAKILRPNHPAAESAFHPSLLPLQLLILGGIRNLKDNAAFQGGLKLANQLIEFHLPNILLFQKTKSVSFFKSFFQSLINRFSIDEAVGQAKRKELNSDRKITIDDPVQFLTQPEALAGASFGLPSNRVQDSDKDIYVWEKQYYPWPTQLRNSELIKINRTLFKAKKTAIHIHGKPGTGKSELINQIIMKFSARFEIVQKFDCRNGILPHEVIFKLAQLLNKTEFYDARLDSLHLNAPGKQMEWLIEALNQKPVLLIFENIQQADIRTVTPENENNLFALIRLLLFGIQKNTKLLFTSQETNPGELTSQVQLMELPAFQYEQVFSWLLAGDRSESFLFDSNNQMVNEKDEIDFAGIYKGIHSKLANDPFLLRFVRYLSDILEEYDWQSQLMKLSPVELKRELFKEFQKLLSPDISKLLLTGSLIPRPFEGELIQFIFSQKSANNNVVKDYLDELSLSGVVIKECITVGEKAKVVYCIQQDYRHFILEQPSPDLAQRQQEIANRIGEYYQIAAKKENILWDWLAARYFFLIADNTSPVEKITEKIIESLHQTKHKTLLLSLIGNWIESNEFPVNDALSSVLYQFLKTVDEPSALKKLQALVEKMQNRSVKIKMQRLFGKLYFELRNFSTALQFFQNSLELAREGEDSVVTSEIEFRVADLNYKLKKYQAASLIYQRILNQVPEAKKPVVLYKLGNIAYLENDYESAQSFYVEALANAIETESTMLQAKILHQLGMLHTDQKNFPEAVKKFSDSLKLKESQVNPGSYADTLHEIANVYYLQSDFKHALEKYEKSFLISAEQGNVEDTAISLHQIGMTYHAMGEQKLAIDKLNESLQIVKEIEDDAGVLDTNYQLGSIYLAAGQEQDALERFSICLNIATKTNDLSSQSDSLHEIGYIYATQGKHEAAKHKLEASLKIAEQLKDTNRIAGTMSELSHVYQELGDKKKGKEYLKNSASLFQNIDGINRKTPRH